MDIGKLRAWWSHRQGLDGSVAADDAAGTLGRTGWARSVGGSGPYLGLHARAGLSREAVDAAVARLEVHELPSARAELARRYFAWAGPASMAHFRWFSGCTAAAAKAAVAGLDLRSVDGTDLLWTEGTAAEYARFTVDSPKSRAPRIAALRAGR